MSRKRSRGARRGGRGGRQAGAPAAHRAPAAHKGSAAHRAPVARQAPAGRLAWRPPAFLQSPVFAVAAFALLCLSLLAAAHVDLTGHDYGYFLPKMLDTQAFYLANGLALQEYTAGLCAGVFQFANPQSMALSLPQGLSYAFGPAFGIAATYVIAAAAAGLGTYLCARFWGLAPLPACVAGVAFAFNGFLLARLAVGHLAFHGFGFAPLLAASLLYGIGALRQGRPGQAAALGCLSALLLAALVYGGIGVALVHALAVAALFLLICGGFDRGWGRALAYCMACLLAGLAAAAPKIEAVLAMNGNLTRDFYPLPGFGALDLPIVWFQSLFWLPSEAAINARFQNQAFHLGWHEIYYSGTPLLPLLLAAGAALGWKRLPWRDWTQRPVALGLAGAALLLAVAVNLYQPQWNAFLKSLPLIGQFSGMTRFFALFIPLLALLLGWLSQAWRQLPLLAVLALTGALAFLQYHAIEGKLRSGMYYDKVALAPVLAAWPSAAGDVPPVTAVAIRQETAPDGSARAVHAPYDDHLLIEGKTNALCYEPLFGYRLEQYRLGSLRAGPIDAADAEGQLNLKNPACYVYPQENQCQPGDPFRAGQRQQMLALARHGDPGMAVSSARQAANWLGAGALLLLIGSLLVHAALRAHNRTTNRNKEDTHG